MLKHVLGHVAAVVRQAAQDANDAGATPVWVCDGTFGAGGYTRAILKAFPNVRVVAIDQDPLVIRLATTMARKFPGRLFPEYGSFRHLDRIVAKHAPQGCHAIVLDIGVSSMQIDTASRGFSYRKDGPLDMRMDRELPALSADPNHEPSSSSSIETRSSPSPAKSVLYYAGHKPLCTAADLVRYLPESRLAALFRVWGQEPFAGRIARHLAEARETRSYRGSGRDRFCATTRELAIRIARAVGFGVSKRERVEDAQQAARGKKHRGGGAPRPREDRFGQDPAQDAAIWRALGTLRTSRHPCRRVFQALRIAVNDELGSLRDAVAAAARPGVLVPGGRLVVVTFQPLEDKVVKQELLRAAGDARACRALGDLSRPPDLTSVTAKLLAATETGELASDDVLSAAGGHAGGGDGAGGAALGSWTHHAARLAHGDGAFMAAGLHSGMPSTRRGRGRARTAADDDPVVAAADGGGRGRRHRTDLIIAARERFIQQQADAQFAAGHLSLTASASASASTDPTTPSTAASAWASVGKTGSVMRLPAPDRPSAAEVARNPRARSALLRWATRAPSVPDARAADAS
ncbi:hypothetical protein CXG81DRAFT_23731 [Caulochytrium protostelioides]|uniref:S-adenosyl-L-methionine-dependent methyltransferase n=1 Tax=Caulochytrium protostelioides TaxID=1555241 RepID=A0A4V1IVC9_9FUNG|nr:hypothetical protein CXG81DRAFT_23731 [Caulochytrium protostelioides]|eukprot:RKP03619.1 hypothetical protein CXG81DRAFT_23731 [Caulochytrium protostelioides]